MMMMIRSKLPSLPSQINLYVFVFLILIHWITGSQSSISNNSISSNNNNNGFVQWADAFMMHPQQRKQRYYYNDDITSSRLSTTTNRIQSKMKSIIYNHNKKNQSSSITSLTICHMVNTKSGGKPILSIEQFQTEVLLQNNNDNDDNNNNDDDDEIKESEKPKPILVLYSAPWCGPCRLINPIVQQIIKQYSKNIQVVEVCTDDLPTIAESAGVVSIPTLQVYYGGRCVDTIVGCVTKNVLSTALDKLLDDLNLGLSSKSSSDKNGDNQEEDDSRKNNKNSNSSDDDTTKEQ